MCNMRWFLCVGVVLCAAGCSDNRVQSTPNPSDKWVTYRQGSGGGTAEVVAAGTGWATLKGRFVLDGAAPSLQPVSASGVAICKDHPIPNESLVVGSNGGVKNIIVYARRVSRIHEDYLTDEWKNKEVKFDQIKCIFTSHVVALQTGQTLMVSNSDQVGHNTNISPPGDVGINPLFSVGQPPLPYSFNKAQNTPVAVSCNIHPWMRSYILPRKDPYFAVTDDQGNFEIKNIPAGEKVEFLVWHESAPKVQGAAGDLKVNGNFSVTIAENETKDVGDIKVPASSFNVK